MVALVLLAAGMSRRFGSPKQLFLFDGRPLVRLMAEKALASRAAPVYVVLGAFREETLAALAGLPLHPVFNPDFAAGQSTSVRRGLEAASGAEAILFLPVDMPFLTVETLDRLIAAWEKERPAAVVPTYDGQRGAPVLWDRRLFPNLAALEGDQGGRVLLSRLDPLLVEVDPHQGRDLDRPEDLPGSFAEKA
jgi:molybdenum cofactor cytidylyltransferase